MARLTASERDTIGMTDSLAQELDVNATCEPLENGLSGEEGLETLVRLRRWYE